MKILLAVDGSESSETVVQEVGTRHWPAGTEMRVITVDAPLGRSAFGASPAIRSAYDEVVASQRQEAQASLEQAVARLREVLPDVTIDSALLEGTPKEEVVEEARRWGAELVVVGSRGRGAVRSLLLGSVSLAVALQAPCSVLIVRRPDPAGA